MTGASRWDELLRELWAVRRRLLPVVLGLSFGTVGLSVLLAFGNGFDVAMRTALGRSGDSMLRWMAGGTTRAFDGLPAGRSIPLTEREVELLAGMPEVVAASPENQQTTRVVSEDGERSTNSTVCGVGADWSHIRGRGVLPGGRFLSPQDNVERRRTAVLGVKVATELFGRRDVVGRTVRIFDAPFLIVGILDPAVALMQYGGDDDLKVIVPFRSAQAMLGWRTVHYALTKIVDPSRAHAVEATLRRVLASRLRFDPEDRPAVRVSNHAAQAAEIRGIIAGTRWFLLIVGGLGLLVAALGVANMTFVLVEERVREIGLRMALGATPGQIRSRQLLETATVVAVGGGSGLLLAAGMLHVVNLLPLPADAKNYLGEPLLSVSAALSIVGLLGLCVGIAGWQPAARAAAVQPVEALRHD